MVTEADVSSVCSAVASGAEVEQVLVQVASVKRIVLAGVLTGWADEEARNSICTQAVLGTLGG